MLTKVFGPMQPTQAGTLKLIRDAGCTAGYNSQYREYRVNVPGGGEATAYYTNDAADALLTARDMIARHNLYHGLKAIAATVHANG